jgi:hypothetical protein
MKTSCFALYQGPGRVCIARWAPRGTPAGYRMFAPLAPGPWFNKVPEDEYRRRYFGEILGPLDPRAVVADLERLAGGAEPVLLCWERPPFTATNWCHRRMVAEWLKSSIGLEVPELELAAPVLAEEPPAPSPPAPKAAAPAGAAQLGLPWRK